jgi:predicted amidohydrolase YtcJ
MRARLILSALAAVFSLSVASSPAAPPTLILHNAKAVTVNAPFSIEQAVAIEGDRITQVGSNADVLKLRGPDTTVVDLKGRMVIPGLMDSHTHPLGRA